MDAAPFTILRFATIMGKHIFGEHRADGQDLVRVRAHHRRDNASAQDPRQPDRRVVGQQVQEDAVGVLQTRFEL